MGVKRNWSELGDDALECILRKLPFIDILRFKSVCTSWNSVAKSYVSSSCYSPWLMLPAGEEECHYNKYCSERSHCFFNLEDNKEFRDVCISEEVYQNLCVGSSHGWLMLLDRRAFLHLLNPFSGDRIPVGSLKDGLEFSKVDADTVKDDPRAFVSKAVLLSNPRTSKDRKMAGVVIIYGSKKKLAFCSYRDGKIIELDGSHQPYHDVICFNNVVSALSDTGSVEAWDFAGCFPAKTMDVEPSFPLKTADFRRCCRYLYSNHFYLVESCGELLFVVRFVGEYINADGKPLGESDLDDDDVIGLYQTLLFHVYRLDRCRKKWLEVKDLGDQVLFIGGNHSMALKSPDCGRRRRNSIYFTDSYWERVDEDQVYGGHDMGIYSLEDGSVEAFFETYRLKFKPTPFWVVPSPW